MAKKLTTNDNIKEKVVDKKTVRNFVMDAEAIASKTSKLNGNKSDLFNRAEQCGVNKAALKDIIKINNMEDNMRAGYLAAFDLYREYMDLDKYDQSDMFKNDEKKVA